MVGVRATSCTGYVCQLLGPPPRCRSLDAWACNTALHVPPNTFSSAMAAQLDKLGLVKFASTTSTGAAALLRTAMNGKIEWKGLLAQLSEGANGLVSLERFASGHLSPPHWLSPPIVVNLAEAAAGELGLKGP